MEPIEQPGSTRNRLRYQRIVFPAGLLVFLAFAAYQYVFLPAEYETVARFYFAPDKFTRPDVFPAKDTRIVSMEELGWTEMRNIEQAARSESVQESVVTDFQLEEHYGLGTGEASAQLDEQLRVFFKPANELWVSFRDRDSLTSYSITVALVERSIAHNKEWLLDLIDARETLFRDQLTDAYQAAPSDTMEVYRLRLQEKLDELEVSRRLINTKEPLYIREPFTRKRELPLGSVLAQAAAAGLLVAFALFWVIFVWDGIRGLREKKAKKNG